MSNLSVLPSADTLTPRQASRALRRAEWQVADAARQAAYEAERTCSFVTTDAPAVGDVRTVTGLGTVRVLRVGRRHPAGGGAWQVRAYCELVLMLPAPARDILPTVRPVYLDDVPASKADAFWRAASAAQMAFEADGGRMAPFAATPKGFTRMRFVNQHGHQATVKQAAQFRCPPARFWPHGVLPASVTAPVSNVRDAWLDLQYAERNLAGWRALLRTAEVQACDQRRCDILVIVHRCTVALRAAKRRHTTQTA